MVDFYNIKEKNIKKERIEIYPDFKVCRSKDLMTRGRSFYAIWNKDTKLWSTDEYDVQRLVDDDLLKYKEEHSDNTDMTIIPKFMSDFSSYSWVAFRNYMSHISDNAHLLDNKLMFSNSKLKKSDYASKVLSYPLQEGSCDAYNELIGTLYDKKERAKLEWAIGSIIAGDSKNIQKFVVLYGEGGTGKSTILNIIQKLFDGYYTTFEAKALTTNNNSFATEVFKTNPLVAIQHDGDLSRIEDNTRLNSIISHEEMTMHEKYKPSYTARTNCMLFLGTNKPVKITDAKSGIIRRLIDVTPTGKKVSPNRYQTLYGKIDFELGAIAHRCLTLYRKMGKNYYASYIPLQMMLRTDIFFNFVELNYQLFKDEDGISLKQAYALYKEYCDDCLIEYKAPRHRFREELSSYFKEFHSIKRVGDVQVRSYFSGFISDKLNEDPGVIEEKLNSLTLDYKESLIDEYLEDCPAQYASTSGTPLLKWAKVKTKLSDIDTSKLHYVKPPAQHLVIDFDLKDKDGNKSSELNIEAASKWPTTYAEFSKSGNGVHLHYLYDGDISKLSRLFKEDIEIKVFSGDSSLRRMLTKNNNVPVATISSGIPMKGEKMVNFEVMKNEASIRTLIKKNLEKKIHAGTKPSMDFIHKILEEAYETNMYYDVKDLRPAVMAFANNSTNQSEYCLALLGQMKFTSDLENYNASVYDSNDIIFFDVEVFPNLFIVVWKRKNAPPVKLINPSPNMIEQLMRMKLVGFNNRRYDNHILYARSMGYTNEQLYKLSKRIINNSANCMFGEAYNLSYTDIYDFSSKKQSLKKFEIELGIHHLELGLDWDEPVPEDKWIQVAEYCVNDVVATEAVFESRKEDFDARKILAELSGLTPNDTTQMHTARIIFGRESNPQKEFEYTDLSEMFPGYEYSFGKSTYRGEEVGEGGYVYAEPGIYTNAALLDIASMHPVSLIAMNAFGPYTKKFEALVNARMTIKHKEYDKAAKMLNGILAPYLTNTENSKKLSYALKIIINIVYGMTSAKFENKFKDPRNVDNIVAKRGALFMIDLKHAVKEKGWQVAHIKTDSIKIPDATKEMIDFVTEFGAKYGYSFEHEATYSKLALVNDAVYVAKESEITKDNEKTKGWTATGAQFQHPYVFKKLFSKEVIDFADLVETKAVTSSLYLDLNEDLPDVKDFEKVKEVREIKELADFEKYSKVRNKDKILCDSWKHLTDEELDREISLGHAYRFIGKVGAFVPMKAGTGTGGILLREKDGKFHAATGSKGYRWAEAEYVQKLNLEDCIDYEFYNGLANKAIDNISKYGDFEWFTEN